LNALPIQTRPSQGSWVVALLLAMALNAAMFGMMPVLFHDTSMPSRSDAPVHPIQFIRVRKPEPPPRVEPKPPPPRTETRRPAAPKIARPQRTAPHLQPRLALPFAVNPRLPPLAGDITVPDLEPAPLAALDLKAVYGQAEIDAPLTPRAQVPPQYPLAAKRRGTEGWVRVRFLVAQDGSVAEVAVLEAVPAGLFENATIRAVRNWRFTPGTVAGVPVTVHVETTVRFELK
jgi:protein TonB